MQVANMKTDLQSIATSTEREKGKPIKTLKSSSNMLLKQSDYQTIKNMFERVMKRQEEMNQKLSSHKEDLKALGKALDSAVVVD